MVAKADFPAVRQAPHCERDFHRLSTETKHCSGGRQPSSPAFVSCTQNLDCNQGRCRRQSGSPDKLSSHRFPAWQGAEAGERRQGTGQPSPPFQALPERLHDRAGIHKGLRPSNSEFICPAKRVESSLNEPGIHAAAADFICKQTITQTRWQAVNAKY